MRRRQFSRFVFAGSAMALATPGALAQVAALTAQQITQNVQKFYDAAATFRAQFKQEYLIRAQGQRKHGHGEVLFAKPGKMRWNYANNGNVVVSDGKTVKVYEAEHKQMYRYKSTQTTQYPAALKFLSGEGKLADSFDLEKLDSAKLKFPGGYVLMGTPKNPTPAYQKILFYIDAATFQVRRVLLLDAQKNRNRFDFERASVNEVMVASAFRYEPPPGTRIIEP
jgi:outer membrane lipoprotein carrier protein